MHNKPSSVLYILSGIDTKLGQQRSINTLKMSLLRIHLLITTIAIVHSFQLYHSNNRIYCNNNVNRQHSLQLFSTVEKTDTETKQSSSDEEKYVIARGDGSTGGGGIPMKKKQQQQQQQQA